MCRRLPASATQIGWRGQTGMARSAAWSRLLFLRHTKISQSDPENLSVALLYIYMGDGPFTQEMSKSPFEPPS